MEQLSAAAPQVETESADLDRGYNVLRKNYEELLARRESSNITAAADTGADKVRLRIVDPPIVPSVPAAPNRVMLISAVLLAGLGAAVGLIIALNQMDQSINDIGRLRELGLPVLGSVSLLPFLRSRPKMYAQSLGIASVMLLLLIVYGGLASQVISYPKLIF